MSTAPGVLSADGFRDRGAQATRLEAFVDAAFAFALTLVVIGETSSGLPGGAIRVKPLVSRIRMVLVSLEVSNFRKAVLLAKALNDSPEVSPQEGQDAWERFERATFGSSVFQVQRKKYRWAVAASIFMAVSVGLWMYLAQINTIYQTSAGEIGRFSLADGSEITLHANARFTEKKFPWLSAKRGGSLEGQGYFKVHKGKKPFVVRTQFFEVEVVGTQFEVATRPWKKGVYVNEGKVHVLLSHTLNKKITLTKNEQIELDKTGNWQKNSGRKLESPNWTKGEFNWINVSLEEVVKEIESIYSIQIKVDASVSNRMISASLPIVKNPTELLDILTGGLGIRWEKQNEKEYRLSLTK